MRRLRVPLALVLAGVLTLAACDSGNDPTTADAKGERPRITVQAAGGESELKALEELAKSFTHADVELIGVGEQGDHMARLATSFAGGDPPDVFLLNYRRFGQFAAKSVIDPADLTNVRADEFHEPAAEAFTFEGRVMCLPQNISSTVTYFNPALFQKAGVPVPTAGWTLDDMFSAAQRLHGAGTQAIGFEHTLRTVAPFVWVNGGQVVDDLDKPTVVDLTTVAGGTTLRYLKAIQSFGIDPAEAAADPAEERFARGELAMFLDSRRAVPRFRRAPGLAFDVAPLPRGMTQASLLASDGYCVSKASKNKEAAHAFAAYAVTPDGAKILAATGRTVPSLKRLAEAPEFLAPGKLPASSKVWIDAIPTLKRLPNVAAWHETEENASDVLEQFFAGKLSEDAAAARIADESRRLLKR